MYVTELYRHVLNVVTLDTSSDSMHVKNERFPFRVGRSVHFQINPPSYLLGLFLALYVMPEVTWTMNR